MLFLQEAIVKSQKMILLRYRKIATEE